MHLSTWNFLFDNGKSKYKCSLEWTWNNVVYVKPCFVMSLGSNARWSRVKPCAWWIVCVIVNWMGNWIRVMIWKGLLLLCINLLFYWRAFLVNYRELFINVKVFDSPLVFQTFTAHFTFTSYKFLIHHLCFKPSLPISLLPHTSFWFTTCVSNLHCPFHFYPIQVFDSPLVFQTFTAHFTFTSYFTWIIL